MGSQMKGAKGSRKGAKGIGKQRRKGKGGSGKGAPMMAVKDVEAEWEHDMFDYGDDDFHSAGDAWSKARGAHKGKGKGSGKSRSKGKRSKGKTYYNDADFLDRDENRNLFDDREPPDRKLSQDDLNMMKKITIVAQLDKVPKPPSAMQGMSFGKNKRESEGNLSRRFAGLDR